RTAHGVEVGALLGSGQLNRRELKDRHLPSRSLIPRRDREKQSRSVYALLLPVVRAQHSCTSRKLSGKSADLLEGQKPLLGERKSRRSRNRCRRRREVRHRLRDRLPDKRDDLS